MIGLIMVAAFVAWLLYCFVFNCGGNYAEGAALHYAIPDLDDDETAPLNPTATREVAAVFAAAGETIEDQREIERS
jgi:hypothetical protein